MSILDDQSISARILIIEDALARALNRGDFNVTSEHGERYLVPVLLGHVMEDAVISRPMLSLNAVAREMERLLS